MLQQTRVQTVVPYYRRWMKRFPSLKSLAHASERDVLRQWEGLGYYARARNLHRASKIVLNEHSGRLPSTRQQLRALPGIGEYTAGAIASMAFGKDEPLLDGNVRRVLARLFGVTQRADTARGITVLRDLAAALLPRGRAGDFNQALMDLGATVCLPSGPRCSICPLASDCKANLRGLQETLPVLAPTKRIPVVVLGAVVASDDDRVLIARRPSHGLLGGMWEFPNAGLQAGADPSTPLEPQFAKELQQKYGVRLVRHRSLTTIRHAYSHFRVIVHAFRCKIRPLPKRPGLRWTRVQDLPRFPMGKVDRRIAGDLSS